MDFQAVIFDLDGTLIDSSEGVVAAFHYAFAAAGLPLPPAEEVKRFIGYPLETMFAHFTDYSPERLRTYFRERAAETIVASTVPLPEVEPTLAALRDRGFRLAIATTKIVANIEGILDKLDWRGVFEAYAGGNEVQAVKPDPEIFRLVLARLGAVPRESLVIGDTINDILAAQAVPLPVIAVASPWEPAGRVLAACPDFFLDSISQLPRVLDEINTRRSPG